MFTLTLIALGASVAQPLPASARDAEPPPTLARPSATAIEAALELLPADTAVAVVVPDPARLFERYREASAGATGLPEISHATLALAEEVGADPHRAAILALAAGDVAVLRLSIASPERFAAWAERTRASGVPASWSPSRVFALPALAGRPLACTARGEILWCQLGASAGVDPLAALRHALDGSRRRLADVEGVLRAAGRLRPDAELYAVASPSSLAERLAEQHRAWTLEEQPFAERAEVPRRPAWVAHAEALRGAALAVHFGTARVESELELALSPRAALAARAAFSGAASDGGIADWARTPALGHLVLRLEPAMAARLLAAFELPVPSELLSGALAWMALGIDTECSAAKVASPGRWERWPFVFPMAAAIGLAGPAVERARLEQALGARASAGADDALFRASVAGGPIEGRWVPGALLVGTGPGAGAAARRRWSAARPGPSRVEAPFVEGELSLASLQAAIAAGSYGRDTQPALHELERWARNLRPIALRYPRLRVEGRRLDGGARLRLTGVAASM